MQNSGVTLEAESMQFSTVKDQNPVVGSMPYYGIIVEIWEVNYTKFTIPVFKCKWVDNKTGVKVDESGMTLVNFRKIGYHDEPFIMAHQASQVFYIQDPTYEHWFVVLHGKNNIMTQKIQTMTFVRLNHLQERPSIKNTRMLLMLYMQLEMIMTKEYIFVCTCDSCLVLQ